MARGKCEVCGVFSEGERDFICGDCGDPNGIKMFCTGCKKRTSLSDDGLVVIEELMERPAKQRAGVVVRVNRCADCSTNAVGFRIKTFFLKLH